MRWSVLFLLIVLNIPVFGQHISKQHNLSLFTGVSHDLKQQANSLVHESLIFVPGVQYDYRLKSFKKLDLSIGFQYAIYGVKRNAVLFEDDIEFMQRRNVQSAFSFTSKQINHVFGIPISIIYGGESWTYKTSLIVATSIIDVNNKFLETDQNTVVERSYSSSNTRELNVFIGQSIQYRIDLGDKLLLVGPQLDVLLLNDLSNLLGRRCYRFGCNLSYEFD